MATGGSTRTTRIITSTSSALRLREAAAFLHDSHPDQDVLVVASSRGAADDLARRAATGRGASLGWHRFSVLQLAARLGIDALAARGRLPGSPLGAEAVASRAIFGAIADGSLRYFSPVAQTPGVPARGVAHHRRTAPGGRRGRRRLGSIAGRSGPGDAAGLHRPRVD